MTRILTQMGKIRQCHSNGHTHTTKQQYYREL